MSGEVTARCGVCGVGGGPAVGPEPLLERAITSSESGKKNYYFYVLSYSKD